MKNSTLVVLLLLAGLTSLHAGTNNIVLKNFQAMQVTEGAKVVWEFTSEERDVTCKLEKSLDGVTFSTITTIFIVSTRQQSLHSYVDKSITGQAFYRLRVTKDSYIPYTSPIVSVTVEKDALVDPQNGGAVPRQNSSVFGMLAMNDSYMSVRLLDMNGQARVKRYMKGTDLENQFRTSLGNIPSGYYVLRINDMQNKTLVNRFIYKY